VRGCALTVMSRGHQCQQLFYLVNEVADNAGAKVAIEDHPTPQLSLFTPSLASARRIPCCYTSQGHHLLALLDTGSTHNFIHAGTMRRIGLVMADSANLCVTEANGDRLPCEGVARNVPIRINLEDFSITCFGINLGCFDFILSVDYLRTLGPILWDFPTPCHSGGRPPHPLAERGLTLYHPRLPVSYPYALRSRGRIVDPITIAGRQLL
jgi:hypothetical protein